MATRGTVLVVDDTPDIAAMIREALAEDGYRVLVAPTVAVALAILAAFRVHLVLTDAFYPVPGATGNPWTALDPLVQATGDLPLVLCTARPAADYAAHAAHGFAAVLTKPFTLDALARLVGALLPDVAASPLAVAPVAHRSLAPRER
jgi:CheY-like chemotaxis protein